MDILLFLNSVVFFIYFLLGIYVLIINYKSSIHQLFFLISLSLSFGTFCNIPALQAVDIKTITWWVKLGWYGFLLFIPFFNHFCILLTMKKKINKFFTLLIYLPTIFFYYKNFTKGVVFKDFYRIGNKWRYIYNTEFTGIYLFGLYVLITVILYIILTIYWKKRDKSLKVRKQSFILLLTAILMILLMVIVVILPFFYKYSFFGYHPLLILVWILGIYISIVKFRFMSFTPSIVSEEIISNIDESIILLDNSLKIIVMNKKSEDIFQYNQAKFKGEYFSKIIFEQENVLKEINKLYNGEIKHVSFWANFKSNDNSKVMMDIKISLVKDKFNDNIGFLVIGKEVKSIKHLKIIYNISEREVEVIKHIINGSTNKEIGKEIGITLRTVKAHITNIYNKLGVNNKSHLLSFLNDFNLSF